MTARPTICFLTGTLNAFAGAERMTAVIANALAERGYRVFVLSLWDRASVFPLHAAVGHHALFEQRPSFKRAYLSTLLGIRRFVRQHAIDILIEVDTMLTLFTAPALLGQGVRRIAWEHCHFDEDLGRKTRRLARWLAGRTNSHLVVLTERDRARWIEGLHPRCKVSCIPNSLPFPSPETPAPRDTKMVLAVGRLTNAKGFDILLNAWAGVVRKAPGWQLTIVGEGEERGALESLRTQLGLDRCVSLPGTHTDIASDYARSAIFCLSSRYEGFGLVLIEAMAHGLPIVSTSCEQGPRELLGPDDAILVPEDNVEALEKALSDLIASPSTADRLAAQGRQNARHYEIGPIADRWITLLG